MCFDVSKTLRRSSCVNSHQAALFRIGINAAQVASGRASPCCFATISLFSSRMTYRSLLVIPRSTQGALVSGCNSEADITLSLLASGSDLPTMVSVPTIRHRPLSPPTNANNRVSIPTPSCECFHFFTASKNLSVAADVRLSHCADISVSRLLRPIHLQWRGLPADSTGAIYFGIFLRTGSI